jgi:hypothetical protein
VAADPAGEDAARGFAAAELIGAPDPVQRRGAPGCALQRQRLTGLDSAPGAAGGAVEVPSESATRGHHLSEPVEIPLLVERVPVQQPAERRSRAGLTLAAVSHALLLAGLPGALPRQLHVAIALFTARGGALSFPKTDSIGGLRDVQHLELRMSLQPGLHQLSEPAIGQCLEGPGRLELFGRRRGRRERPTLWPAARPATPEAAKPGPVLALRAVAAGADVRGLEGTRTGSHEPLLAGAQRGTVAGHRVEHPLLHVVGEVEVTERACAGVE